MDRKTYMVVAAVALLAAAASRPARRRTRNPLSLGKKPPTPALDTPKHVGMPDYVRWPLYERFADGPTFQRAFRTLGYEVPKGLDILDDAMQEIVAAFKLDFNTVTEEEYLGHSLKDARGLLDDETIYAVAAALDLQKERDEDWFQHVDLALHAAKPEVG